MDEMNVLVEEQIRLLSAKMQELTPGTEEYSRAANALAALYKVRDEENRAQTEDTRKGVDSKKERKLKIAEIVVGGIGGIVLPVVGFVLGLHFEESGSLSSPITKDFMKKILRGR